MILLLLLGLLLAGCEVSNLPVETPTAAVSDAETELLKKLLAFHAVQVEVGKELVPLLSDGLLARVPEVRRTILAETGVVLPGVNFMDDLRLKPREYVIKLRGVEAGRGVLELDRVLAVGFPEQLKPFGGATSRDPAQGLPAAWIPASSGPAAEKRGCVVLDPAHVFSTHLTECVRRHDEELLDLTGVELLLEEVKKTNPPAAALVPDKIALPQLQQVLQKLLAEQVKVHDLARILEVMSAQPLTVSTDELAETVRQALGRQLCQEYAGPGQTLKVIMVRSAPTRALYPRLDRALEKCDVLLTSPETRRAWRDFVRPVADRAVVLSTAEIAPGYTVSAVAEL